MSIKNATLIAIIALLLAWSFDQLFWQKAPGVSFALFIVLCLAAGIFLTWREGLRPALASLLLLPPVLYFAAVTFLRQEPFTTFISAGLALAGTVLLSITWLGGRWWQYSLVDYLMNGILWAGYTLAHPLQVFPPAWRACRTSSEPENEAANPATTRGPIPSRPYLAVLLGVLLALPVVSLVGALLASADPVFSRQLQSLLRFLDLEKLDEYLFRLVYIMILAYLLSGVLLYALLTSPTEKLSPDRPYGPARGLGWLEAGIILASVDLLFAFFVMVQFRYFFGGQANIHLEGFTYAEYARRGFNELVAVAVISLLLFLGLSAITRREAGLPRRLFSGFGIGLVLLVGVILVSAFQRLLLYEAAYGFSRQRTYTHIFILWLGLLLLVTALLEGAGRLRYFALAATLASLGFGVTLSLLNVDRFIVRQNVRRAAAGAELDTTYLASLSDDAVPALFAGFDDSLLSPNLRDDLAAALVCRAAIEGSNRVSPRPWPSYHWSRAQAQRLYTVHQGVLKEYPVETAPDGWRVKVNGIFRPCPPPVWVD